MESIPTRSTRLAVVPSQEFTGEGQEESYFGSGIIVDLVTELSRFSEIDVISPHSSFAPRLLEFEDSEIARELGTDLLLKVGIRKREDSVRINAHLTDPESSSLLWAEKYDVRLAELIQTQDSLVEQISAALSVRIQTSKLDSARRKPIEQLEAYDWWLRGMDYLRKGTLEGDEEAREYFENALEKDSHFARAYLGLSLSHFNEWSCQSWELRELSECRAFQYATKAFELDENDSQTHVVLGRVYWFRQQFERAETHLNRAYELNPNDADALVMLASGFTFMGDSDRGAALWERATRLNPFFPPWYYAFGGFIRIMQGDYEEGITMSLKAPISTVWIDLAAFIALAYAYLGNMEKAKAYRDIFLEAFRDKITKGRDPHPNEAFEWLVYVNAFKCPNDSETYQDGLKLAGFCSTEPSTSSIYRKSLPPTQTSSEFRLESDIRHIAFDSTHLQLPEVKGFQDLEELLKRNGEEVHCTELMGVTSETGEPYEALDSKARNDCASRIRELQTDLLEAEEANDSTRAEAIREELDPLIDYLAKAVGIGGRSRHLAAPAERARSAVTWRIRNAIKKIEAADKTIGRHFKNAVRTGAFCSYQPEKPVAWKF